MLPAPTLLLPALSLLIAALCACRPAAPATTAQPVTTLLPAASPGPDPQLNPFWDAGMPLFDTLQLFDEGRFPNIVTGTDGTVIATFVSSTYYARRSEDSGITWGPPIVVASPGCHGGGTLVDENTGDILAFVEDTLPPAPMTLYRSRDQGRTWQPEATVIRPDSRGQVPSMYMNEHGITLRRGPHAGRLIRPTHVYAGDNEAHFWDQHYTNAMYSDDGGHTWQTSEPFPAYGTGEAAIEELADGILYYNSRRHRSTDDLNCPMRHIA
ncbi:MAG: hypothetical protein OHK0039_27530 [Bacteroidia bacterium]